MCKIMGKFIGPFCFLYVTVFTKIGLMLPLGCFEKQVLTIVNVPPPS